MEEYGVFGFQEEEEYCEDDWLHRYKKTNPPLWSLLLHTYSQMWTEKVGRWMSRISAACFEGGNSNRLNHGAVTIGLLEKSWHIFATKSRKNMSWLLWQPNSKSFSIIGKPLSVDLLKSKQSPLLTLPLHQLFSQ